jgi:hypothetical protein
MHRHINLVTTFSNRNHAEISIVQSLTGVAYAHLVRYSVAVMTYLSLDLLASGLIGPTKSMAHLSNDCNITYGFNDISSLL